MLIWCEEQELLYGFIKSELSRQTDPFNKITSLCDFRLFEATGLQPSQLNPWKKGGGVKKPNEPRFFFG